MAEGISVKVTVNRAKGLKDVDGLLGGASDPFVVLRVNRGTSSFRTKTKDSTLNPNWDETFCFVISDKSFVLSCEVWDQNKFGQKDKFLGRCEVRGAEICGGQPDVDQSVWYELGGEQGQGQLQLTFRWASGPAPRGQAATVIGPEDPKATPQALQDFMKQQEEAELRRQKEVQQMKLKTGDYQVLIHVIEASDLCPKDGTNTCDPVVKVEVCGQVEQTRIQSQCTSCFFDQHMVFELPAMGLPELRTATIKFVVEDSDWLFDDPVGVCELELLHCYFQPNHEFWKHSICLVSEEDPGRGPQGFLRVSITVLGPEDTQPDHVTAMGREDLEVKLGVFFPPAVQLQLFFLVVGLHRAEDLPAMDNVAGVQHSTDAFFEVKVNGSRSVISSVKTESGPHISPVFDEELWIPILLPSRDTKLISDKITITAWDADGLSSNDRIGTIYLSLWKDVQAKGGQSGKRWYNMYGPPAMIGDAEQEERMTLYPSLASMFRGRALLSLRLEQGSEANEVRKMSPVVPSHNYCDEPGLEKYVLRAAFLGAAFLPDLEDLFVRISIGAYSIDFAKLPKSEGGGSTSHQPVQKELPPLLLPMDLEQTPDVCIYLARGTGGLEHFWRSIRMKQVSDTVDVSFLRIPARDLLARRFQAAPTWYNLSGNRATRVLDVGSGDLPGSLLLQLGLGTVKQATATPWQLDDGYLGSRVSYEMRLHLYRARDLPLGDKASARDPYLKILSWGSKAVQPGWSRQRETCQPAWYETQVLRADFPRNAPLPDVIVQVWDAAACYLMSDSYIGHASIPLSQAVRRSGGEDAAAPPGKWYPIQALGVDGGCGELLASVELCSLPVKNPIPRSIKPPLKKCTVEIFALGLRGLQSHCVPSGSPYCQFEVGNVGHAENADAKKTRSSCRPSPCAPNFLDRIVLEGMFPEGHYESRNLHVRVMDARYGGVVSTLLGVATIPLQSFKKSVSMGAAAPAQNPNVEVNIHEVALLPQRPDAGTKPLDLVTGGDTVFTWMAGRATLHTGLEEEIASTCKFQSFPILRGVSTGRTGLFSKAAAVSTRARVEGWFKGCVAMVDGQGQSPINVTELLKRTELVVRVYVLRGLNLRCASDANVSPYLVLKLGDWSLNDSDHTCDIHQHANFHRVFEVPAKLPGASRLTIEVWNRGMVTDTLIGVTTIDIEDRWYNDGWHELAREPLPVERRPLWAKTKKQEQGKLELWLDIIKADKAKIERPLDIALPPSEQYEVRVVIWKTKDLSTLQEDCFVKCRLGDSASQATDTHWQCTRGNGSFNYRMVFPLELAWHELDAETPKTKLYFQVYDAQVIVFKACLAERFVDLRKYFLFARRHSNGCLDLFSESAKEEGKGFVDDGNGGALPPYQKGMRMPGICVSINIVSKEFAESFPVGLGQDEPNNFPYLPAPSGRHGWSNFLNPCFFLDELDYCGTTRQRLACCVPMLVWAVVMVVAFTMAQLNAILPHFGTTIISILLAAILVLALLTALKCRRVSPRQRETQGKLIKHQVATALGTPPDPPSSGWLTLHMVDSTHDSGWGAPPKPGPQAPASVLPVPELPDAPPKAKARLGAAAPPAKRAMAEEAEGLLRCYELTKGSEEAVLPGVAYRTSKSLAAWDEELPPLGWGDRVLGVDEGDGWLRVGGRFLPMRLDGLAVLLEVDEPPPGDGSDGDSWPAVASPPEEMPSAQPSPQKRVPIKIKSGSRPQRWPAVAGDTE